MIATRSLAALVPALGLIAAMGAADAPDLKQAEAEADKLDPGWRLADLLAKRAKLPPEKNGAARVLDVFGAMPEEWKDLFAPTKVPGDLKKALDAFLKTAADDPARPVFPEVTDALQAHQAKIAPLLARARDLEKYATGRYELTFGLNPLEVRLTHLNDARAVARLLQFDALTRAAAGDIDGGIGSARAILGVARSIGDEPFMISQIIRWTIESQAAEAIGQVLARGEAPDAALASTQAAIAEQETQPLLLFALRGERAALYDVMEKVTSGKIDAKAMAGPLFERRSSELFSAIRGDEALALDLFNLAVETSKKPLPDQFTLWDRWAADTKKFAAADPDRFDRVSGITPAFAPLSEGYLRTRAILRVAETMVGLERVRLASGHWPRPGESLAPAFMQGPPADPFTGKPILWKATPTGLVVYSVGYDRLDDGGKLENRNVKQAGTDIGLRLWDVARRPEPARSR